LQVVYEEVGVSRAHSTTAVVLPPDRPDEPAARAMRADARRNRDALLAAAAQLYAERGVEASLEEVARRAGVGIGTLYRHFPHRDALNEAVYRREVELLCDGAENLQADHPADVALATWMRNFAGYVATKKGMAQALRSVLGEDNELFTHSRERIESSLGTLVDAAIASGAIRADADANDLLRAMSGICMTSDSPEWRDRAERLIDLLVDGLRYGAPASVATS
jgi:AcrR family transcriptional regulator